MKVTEVRIAPSPNPNDRLLGFASMVIDGEFVISDIKIISGPNGIFVAMPSRKVAAHCPTCQMKNAMGSKFCNDCGSRLPAVTVSLDARPKLFTDIAHPINAETRKMIEAEIMKAYHAQAETGAVATVPAAEAMPARVGRRFGATG